MCGASTISLIRLSERRVQGDPAYDPAYEGDVAKGLKNPPQKGTSPPFFAG